MKSVECQTSSQWGAARGQLCHALQSCKLVPAWDPRHGSQLISSPGCLASTGRVQWTLESPAVAGQCRERSELGRYPAGTHTGHQQYSAWLAASAVSVARPSNNDHRPLRLAAWLNEKEWRTAELWHGHWDHQQLAERRATAQQALSSNAALSCVTGCVDAVFLTIVRWSDREHLFIRKEERHAILDTENIKICGRITKLEALKNAICLHFLLYLQKIWIFNIPR